MTFALAPLILLLYLSPALGDHAITPPSEYGGVVFRYNEKSRNQLHVIGMSHRDTLTRRNGKSTARVQAEVYKIGDWFIRYRDLNLLLPEGFFARTPVKVVSAKPSSGENNQPKEVVNMKDLQRILSEDRKFVNAEILLKQHHSVMIQQVEDEISYDAVNKALHNLAAREKGSGNYFLLKSELEYLEERRLAAMLQRIPEVVDTEFEQGNTRKKEAVFTIGMYHIRKIIEYFTEGRIKIFPPVSASEKYVDYSAELNLAKENYGLCITIPKTLLYDQEVLKINKLDRIVAQSNNGFPSSSPAFLNPLKK